MNNNIYIYTGQAGTGKTTKLIEKLTNCISERDWFDHESVLAITFMHGSRKRLNSKLKFIKSKFNLNYKCITIDSFALALLNKFRSYLGISKVINALLNNNIQYIYEPNEFDLFFPLAEIKNYCLRLLEISSVKEYLKNSYPIIIIDEFQDCIDELFEIIKKLSSITNLLIATDQFQQLIDPENLMGDSWIKENNFNVIDLDKQIWRTRNNRLLISAKALRTGQKIDGDKIRVYARPGSKGVVSAKIKEYLFYWLSNNNRIAIIYPSKSNYVERSIDELSTKYKFKKGKYKDKEIGPYKHLITSVLKTSLAVIATGLEAKEYNIHELKNMSLNGHYIVKRASSVALRRLKLRNLSKINFEDFSSILNQICHMYDNFILSDKTSKIISTTVHGAKNREFDYVIVLWPYKISGSNLYRRKLLYNAITRAKKSAIIIVQHKNIKIEELKDHELFGLLIN